MKVQEEKIIVKCTCKEPGRISPNVHDGNCEYDKARRATCYKELIGNKSRGCERPPVELPDECPVCGAPAFFKKDGQFANRIYGCKGSYDMKPQIQNHTDYFAGHCGRFNLIEKG